MADSGFVALLLRSLVALGIVLAIIAVAYVVMRARGPVAAGSRPRRPGRTGGRRRSAQAPIEVVGRAGLTRGSAVVALRFGDRIVLVSASDQGATNVLAEMDAARWDELSVEREPIDPATLQEMYELPATRGSGTVGATSGPIPGPARPSFLEALREATTRRA